MSISVFLANVSHTEYKSQLRKAKARKIAAAILDNTTTETNSNDKNQ